MKKSKTLPSLLLGVGLLSGAVQVGADELSSPTACAEPVSAQALAAERQAVEYLRRAYAIATDRAGGTAGEAQVDEARQIYRRIFTADARIRVTMDGQVTCQAQGPDAWLEEVISALEPYSGVQHLIGTQWVDIDCMPGQGRNGEARMSSYLQAWHDRGGEQLYMLIGTYYDQVRYEPDIGWQIHDMELRAVSTEKRALGLP